MSRDSMPRLQSLLQAFRRITRAPEPTGVSVDGSEPEGDGAAQGRPEALADPCATTPISVVIANCGGPEATARCLAAALAQRFDPYAFEVIVVDDSASDEVRAMVRALTPGSGAPAVRYLRVEGAGPVAARNHGWRAATGALVAFSDDRSLPDPDWLAGGERAMRAGHLALGASVCVPASRQAALAAQLSELQGASAFVRREALERVGGFDERCVTV